MSDVEDVEPIEELQLWARARGHQALLALTFMALDQAVEHELVPTGDQCDGIAVYTYAPTSKRNHPAIVRYARQQAREWLAENPGYLDSADTIVDVHSHLMLGARQRRKLGGPAPIEVRRQTELDLEALGERESTAELTSAERPRALAAASSSSWRAILGGPWPELSADELLAIARARRERAASLPAADVAALDAALQAASEELGPLARQT